MSHGLKKGFIGMMWMACVAVISACSPSPAAEPAVLPPEEQVRTVSVERDGVAADCGNREQIGELLSILADMEPTNLQSVQDVPQADAYTSIHFEDTRTARSMWSSPARGSTSRPQPLASCWMIFWNPGNQC